MAVLDKRNPCRSRSRGWRIRARGGQRTGRCARMIHQSHLSAGVGFQQVNSSYRASNPRELVLLADPIAIAVLVAAVAVTVSAVASVVVAVSGSTRCRGSYCRGTDRRSAIRIVPATIGGTAIGHGTTAIGHTTARNGTTADTRRANPSASTGTATTVSERVIRNEGHPYKEGGRETYDNTTQHWCSPSKADIAASRAALRSTGTPRPARRLPISRWCCQTAQQARSTTSSHAADVVVSSGGSSPRQLVAVGRQTALINRDPSGSSAATGEPAAA